MDKASDKDVNFKYSWDGVIWSEKSETKTGYRYDISVIDVADCKEGEIELYGLIVNTITLKAGETTASGNIFWGFNNETARPGKALEGFIGIVIGEEGNDGNYSTDDAVYAWIPRYAMLEGAKPFARFDNMDELQKTLDKVNAGTIDTVGELLLPIFTEDGMSFTHELAETTVVKKGVQTGDNNELGLWMAVMAFAGVAAAAVALKRREN